ncbi:zinc finger CCHC domain-containing protein 10-like [Acanthaster planci]|uniref:Zinc finger CCHC domain-containing protein 10-like n=1 Tax=Acanthaster planci TaxID=133434 RepID=A0A8B7Z2U9_ACAPL|nr:zinc finger CCHC domain-containing protein 10-like [Acanthaster planci]
MATHMALMKAKNNQNKENVRCQKCLEFGHWTYECSGKRKYVQRTSRMSHLNKKIKQAKEQAETQLVPKTDGKPAHAKSKKSKRRKASSSSSSSSSDEDSSEDSDSSDTDSDSSDSSSSDSSDASDSDSSDSSSTITSSSGSTSSSSTSDSDRGKKIPRKKRRR